MSCKLKIICLRVKVFKLTNLELVEFIEEVLEILGFLDSIDELVLGLLAGNIGLC